MTIRTFTIMALGYEERRWVRPAQTPPFLALQVIQHTLAEELGIVGAVGDEVVIDTTDTSEALARHVGVGTLYTAPASGGR